MIDRIRSRYRRYPSIFEILKNAFRSFSQDRVYLYQRVLNKFDFTHTHTRAIPGVRPAVQGRIKWPLIIFLQMKNTRNKVCNERKINFLVSLFTTHFSSEYDRPAKRMHRRLDIVVPTSTFFLVRWFGKQNSYKKKKIFVASSSSNRPVTKGKKIYAFYVDS